MSRYLRPFADRPIRGVHAVVFAALVLAIASTAWPDDAADAIINKGIEAMGGEARLTKGRATASKVRGTFALGDNAFEFRIEQTTDGLERMRVTYEGGKKVVTVIDGDKGWIKEGEMEAREMEEEELADQKWRLLSGLVALTLVPLKGKDFKFKTEAVGDEKVGGKLAAGVKVTGPNDKNFTIYFDKESGLPVKLVEDMPDPESPGQEFTQETYDSDYKDFSGIKQPTKVEIKRDGETFIKIELVDFQVLDKVDDKTFAKPASADDSDSFRVTLQKLGVRRLSSQIEQDPTNALNFVKRGLLHRTLGETDKALEDYDKAIRLGLTENAVALSVAHDGRGWAWAAKGEHEKALTDYDEAIRLEPKNTAPYIGRASSWGAKGEWEKALAGYDEAIRLNPNSSEAHRGRGKAWEAKGEHDKAITDYDEALRLDRKNSDTRRARGEVSYENGEYDEALADYDEAIGLDPRNAKAFVGRGNAWHAKRESDKALAAYNEAIRLDPKNSEAYISRGSAWGAKGEYDKALADYDEAIRLDPESLDAYLGRGAAWHDKGESDKAIAAYNEAIRLDPENSDAYLGRGAAWGAKGEYDKALADYDEAIRLDPKNWKKAIEDFKKAGERTAWKDFAVLDALAAAYAEAGMSDKAVEWQEKAITLAPEAQKERCRARLKLYREGKP